MFTADSNNLIRETSSLDIIKNHPIVSTPDIQSSLQFV